MGKEARAKGSVVCNAKRIGELLLLVGVWVRGFGRNPSTLSAWNRWVGKMLSLLSRFSQLIRSTDDIHVVRPCRVGVSCLLGYAVEDRKQKIRPARRMQFKATKQRAPLGVNINCD